MTKTDRYVECSAAGMKYRLIPVTDEIIRCMIAKDEVKTEQESLIIEKKEYPQVPFEAAEADGAVTVKTSAVQAELNLKTGGITWKHADGSVWLEQNKADLTRIDVVHYNTGGEKPIINRVKTVDGERNFIQNLKAEKARDGYRARVFFDWKELTEVFERMDDSNVRELLEEIKKTPRIFLLAAGREGLATKSFAMRLMHLGKESFWIWDDTTPSIGEGDLMICACGSANVGHENYVADMAKKNGAKLALITPSSEGFLLSIADMVVNVPAAAYKAVGDFVPSEQLMGNLFEQTLFIFYDILVMMLREEMDIKPEEMVARHRNVE